MKRKIGVMAAVLVILAGAMGAQAATVAHWRFETDSGAAVTNGQVVVSVDDVSGNGWSLTNVASTVVCTYGTNIYFADPVPRTRDANRFMGIFSRSTLANGAFDANLSMDHFTVEMFFSHSEVHAGISLIKLGNLTVSLTWTPTGISSFRWGVTTWFDQYPETLVDVNTTHHVAVVFNPGFNLYLDGVLIDSGPAYGDTLLGTGIFLGNTVTYPYQGSLDEVRISDVALPPNRFLNAPLTGTLIMFQ